MSSTVPGRPYLFTAFAFKHSDLHPGCYEVTRYMLAATCSHDAEKVLLSYHFNHLARSDVAGFIETDEHAQAVHPTIVATELHRLSAMVSSEEHFQGWVADSASPQPGRPQMMRRLIL